MRRAVVALAAVAAVVAFLFSVCGDGRPGGGSIDAGSPSAFDSALRSLRGKPVVVNYWATWCEPCKSEMPRIVAAAKKYSGRVHFLGVDVEDDTKTAASFARRYGMTFRSLSDPDGKIRRDQDILGLPVTVFYAADGELKFLHNGEIFEKELETKIEEVLALAADRSSDG